MQVELSSIAQALLEKRVASGAYASASDAIEDGLRVLQSLEELRAARFRADVEVGLDELDRGESIPWEEVRDEARARIADSRKATAE